MIISYDKSGNKYYYNNIGYWHRVDDPAVEDFNGDKYWYRNGKLHKVDGPIAFLNGDKSSYSIKGYYLFDYEFNNWIERIKTLYYDKRD